MAKRPLTPKQYARVLRTRIKRIDKLKLTAMDKTVRELRKRVITRHLSGPTTAHSVRKQSGTLIKSIITTKATLSKGFFRGIFGGSDSAVATFTFQDPKAHVHIGKRGRRTKIRPVRGTFLAIPTSFARNKSGVPQGGPLSGKWKNTFVAGDIIFGSKSRGRKVLPLFTLRDEVIVPQRVDIKLDIVRPGEVIYMRHIRAGLDRILK